MKQCAAALCSLNTTKHTELFRKPSEKNIAELLEISKDASPAKKEKLTKQERENMIMKLEHDMREASKMLEFEYAAILRDRIIELRGE